MSVLNTTPTLLETSLRWGSGARRGGAELAEREWVGGCVGRYVGVLLVAVVVVAVVAVALVVVVVTVFLWAGGGGLACAAPGFASGTCSASEV